MSGTAQPIVDDAAVEQLGINVIRGLAMDAPEAAKSGHTGTAMALAPLAHVLWTRVMRHDPSDPTWPDRDRFVLSNGHASILLYSMLYLTGYDLSLDDLKAFRQWGSRTPGHPERRHTPGVEVTTGPLGQGVANGVGMGIAERFLRSKFGPDVVDHHTFVFAGDGCFEEGISHEAASLAGHLQLGRLVYVYDDNHISIDGPTELAYTDNVPERFAAYGWDVDTVGEVANDTVALERALRRAMAVEDRPSLIVLRSHIGWPSPHLTDTNKAHGDPFGTDEIRLTKQILGLPPDETFWVPDQVLEMYRRCIPRGQAMRAALGGSLRRLGRGPSGLGRRLGRAGSGRLGGQTAQLRGGPADRHPQGRQRLPDRHPGPDPGAGSRCGRPHRQHRHEAERRRRAGAPTPRWPPGLLRHPRARHGGGDDRHVPPRRCAARRGDVLRIQRLHARCRAAGRALEGPRHLLVDPRLGGPGPGRPDPPADRAAGLPAGHARPPGGAPGGR